MLRIQRVDFGGPPQDVGAVLCMFSNGIDRFFKVRLDGAEI